ncbi:MAG: SGNH/GDSL hydrolase family protein [Candidatus Peregrinibacteria bacterium]
MRLREIFINGSLAIGSVVFLIAAMEILPRVTGILTTAPNPPHIYQQSAYPEISYELIPFIRERAFKSTVTTNSLGFRSPERDPSRPLIAVLGDSITFGLGVEDDESLAARLERLLPEFQFMNAGVPGYNLAQEMGTYQRKIVPLHPRAFILVFFFNDFGAGEAARLTEDGTLRPKNWRPEDLQCSPIREGILGWLPGACWLDTHSVIYKAIKIIVNARTGVIQSQKDRVQSREHPNTQESTDGVMNYRKELLTLTTNLPHNLPRLFVIWPDNSIHPRVVPALKNAAEEAGFTVVDLYELFGNNVETLTARGDVVHPTPASIGKAAAFIKEPLLTILNP